MQAPQAPLYKIRWRFDFADRSSKCGMWSQPATRDEDKACFVNTTGLVRASIEGKEYQPSGFEDKVVTLAECDGHDFVLFKWNAVFLGGTIPGKGPGKHMLLGLKLVTRDIEVDVYPNGETRVSQRSEEDKKFHYAAFGR